MPLFKRGKRQGEENLQWLYRNLEELEESETSREGAEAEEAGADRDGDDAGVEPVLEPILEPVDHGPVVSEPPLPEPVMTEAPPPKPVLSERPPSEPTATEPPPVEIPAPVVGASLLAQDEIAPTENETNERRNRQMSGNRRETAPFANRGQPPPPPQQPPRPKRQETPLSETTTDTIVGPQSFFTGTFRSEKDLRIEGTFEGEIDCRGTVIVAKDANLSATVRARNIEIAGAVTGDVFIEERLHLRASGELRGQSHAASFIVEEGGYFEGEMKMGAVDQDDWPTIGDGSSSSEGLGLPIEPTQWTTKRSESRANRPSAGPIDSSRDDTGSGRHRNI